MTTFARRLKIRPIKNRRKKNSGKSSLKFRLVLVDMARHCRSLPQFWSLIPAALPVRIETAWSFDEKVVGRVIKLLFRSDALSSLPPPFRLPSSARSADREGIRGRSRPRQSRAPAVIRSLVPSPADTGCRPLRTFANSGVRRAGQSRGRRAIEFSSERINCEIVDHRRAAARPHASGRLGKSGTKK